MELQTIYTALKQGDFVAVSDRSDREDEADLIIAAETITDEQMAFLIRYTSGIICVSMLAERLAELELESLTETNTANFGTPFVMPVDHKSNCGGVSAPERVVTIKALINPDTKIGDLGRPGHVFPLKAHADGLKGRDGHTEASLELIQKTDFYPAAVIGELMSEDGIMMRGKILEEFLDKFSIPLISINEIIAQL